MAQQVVVGAHPYVYCQHRADRDLFPILDQIFADMKAAGLDGIELMHTIYQNDGAAERVAELHERHQLPVIGSSFGANMWDRQQHAAIMEEAEVLVAGLAMVGGRTLGTSVGKAPGPKTPEQFDAQADLLRELIALCEANGLVLNLHNHTYEVENGEHDLRGTLERVPEAKLGPDLNWCLRGGVDPVDFIRRYAGQIVFLHLRDQHADGRWSESLGEGDMDYKAIGDALREVGFSGDAAIELAHERDFELTRPLGESLRMSRECVREAMGW